MRMIDADAFDDVLIHGELKARKARKYVLESAINTIRGNLAKMPTIEERKAGRWLRWDKTPAGIWQAHGVWCSECDELAECASDYCPWCGAKMEARE